MLSLHVCTEALNAEDAKLRSGFAKIRDSVNTVDHTQKSHMCSRRSKKSTMSCFMKPCDLIYKSVIHATVIKIFITII